MGLCRGMVQCRGTNGAGVRTEMRLCSEPGSGRPAGTQLCSETGSRQGLGLGLSQSQGRDGLGPEPGPA